MIETIMVLLILSVVFSSLILVGLLTLLGMALWLLNQMRMVGAVKVLISRKQP